MRVANRVRLARMTSEASLERVGIEEISPQPPTPIGRRIDEPPTPSSTPPPPVPAEPPLVRAPGALWRGRSGAAEPGAPAAEAEQPGFAPRRARLYLAQVNPWSVMKVGFMLSVAVAVVIITAVAATWWLLDFSGTFLTLSRTVDDIIGAGTTTFDLEALLAFERVFGAAVVIAALEIVLVSVLAGLFAILYNLTVGITGGVEVTFSDAV